MEGFLVSGQFSNHTTTVSGSIATVVIQDIYAASTNQINEHTQRKQIEKEEELFISIDI